MSYVKIISALMEASEQAIHWTIRDDTFKYNLENGKVTFTVDKIFKNPNGDDLEITKEIAIFDREEKDSRYIILIDGSPTAEVARENLVQALLAYI